MSFAQFYQEGGVFMHQILVCAVIGSVFVFKGLRRVRDPQVALRSFELAAGLVGAAMIFGVLGLTMGIGELCGALQSIPPEQWPGALARATPITTYPLAFASMIGAPIWAFVVGGRYAARRPREETA